MNENCRPSPCGIVCKTCLHLSEGCAGCFGGGGVEDCYIKECTGKRKIAGCWECLEFPCGRIERIDPAWVGLTLGLIESVAELGDSKYSELALKNIGEYAEYGDFRFKTKEEIKTLVRGD
jgi:hypothetical protein